MLKTFLDWSAYKDAGMGDAYADIPKNGGDYAKAVAVCINSRQCEEHDKQVMCPSFRVTGNKHLSTGGRVQLLKHALNNLDENNAQFLETDLQDAIELCVSCKGCKRECENNVDMALIKSEFLAQRNQLKKMSFRSKVFAKIPDLINSSRWLNSAVRLRNSSKLIALWAEKLVGISHKINLPEPVSSSDSPLEILLSSYSIKTVEPVVAEVCLFVDTFCKNFEPNIVLDAVIVLSQAGYKVSLVNAAKHENLCCGRTYLAQGMIKEAQTKALALVATLYEKVNAGISVIGLEASCVLGLRDDALALFSDADIKKK